MSASLKLITAARKVIEKIFAFKILNMVGRPQKEYSAVVNAIATLTTFAGSLTLASQFVITCPGSRLQVLLGLASQLFLASLMGVMVVFFLIYGFDEGNPVPGIWHFLIVIQFVLVGFMEITAFLLLSIAILVAGNLVTGVWGLVLISVMVVGTFVVGATVWCRGPGIRDSENPRLATENQAPSESQTSGVGRQSDSSATPPKKSMGTKFRFLAVPVLLFFEFIGFGLLLGYGAGAAEDANPQWGCAGNTSFTTYEKA